MTRRPATDDAPALPRDGRARLHFDLLSLELFIATAELGNVTRAAERLHLAPAAASRRIQELESQFGIPFFERKPHGMALTDAGRAMLAHARNVQHTVQRMRDDAASYRGGQQGVVRLAAPKSAMTQFVPADIERCALACPGVRIDVQEMNSQQIQQALRRGTVDIGIYEASLGGIGLPILPYRQDRLVVVTAAGHGLAGWHSVTIDDILDHDVIGLGEGSALTLRLQRLADERGRVLRLRMRVSGFDSMAQLVAQGLGIGVMPQRVARAIAASRRFTTRAIDGDWADRDFIVCHRAAETLSGAARQIVHHLAGAGAGAGAGAVTGT